MNAVFDDTAKEEVRMRADITAVVGRYVKLRQSGATLKGLCPFHKEKTPSFHVNPSRGFFHCFGCGKGGDVFRFLQEIEGLTFPEALKMLAEETGVTLPSRSALSAPRESTAQNDPSISKTTMLEIHKIAADFFYGQIRNYPEAIAYFKSRGLAAETVRDFKLGYSPPGWTSFSMFAEKKGIGIDALAACGLAIKKEDGSAYDRFRDRVMFSLFDLSGRIVGFAGRGRDKDSTPKYLNSPETAIYRKKEFLYGLNVTRQYIKDQKYVLVVEGYMDFLTLYQAGIRNVVATSGTAMTAEHGHLLKRFTPRVVLVFDGDAAGQSAAQRGIFTLTPLDLDISVLILPPDEDPDSFVKKNGPEAFRKLITTTTPANNFIIDKTIAEQGGRTPREQKSVIDQLVPLISLMSNEIARMQFRKILAARLNVKEDVVYKQLKTRDSVNVCEEDIYLSTLEGGFLHMLFTRPELIVIARQYIAPQTLTDTVASDIYSILLKSYDEKGNLDGITDRTSEGEAQRLISRMLVNPALEENIQGELVRKIFYLRKKYLQTRIRDIHRQLKQPEGEKALLLAELNNCTSQLKDLEEGE
jgi:DNA primase